MKIISYVIVGIIITVLGLVSVNYNGKVKVGMQRHYYTIISNKTSGVKLWDREFSANRSIQ